MSATRTAGQGTRTEAARMLMFLRAIGTEDQRIAYAVLEGMHLQKRLDEQRMEPPPKIGQAGGQRKVQAPA